MYDSFITSIFVVIVFLVIYSVYKLIFLFIGRKKDEAKKNSIFEKVANWLSSFITNLL